MRLIRFISVLLFAITAGATNSYSQVSEEKLGSKPVFNQVDAEGRKQGWWWVDQPAMRGEPAHSDLGAYINGQKNGPWYSINSLGEVTAIETFRNNVLNGEAKYFENGRLAMVGTYRGLNPDSKYDTIDVVDPTTGFSHKVAVESARGHVRHGTWRFYDSNTGRMIREEEYQVDELIAHKDFASVATDSATVKRRVQQMPHNQKKPPYQPPANKRSFTR